jgi:dephospho-CoA kinase
MKEITPVGASGLGGPDAPVLVLAGGTGTGKSMLAAELAARGAYVVDADRIGHEVLLDPDVRARLVAAFGTGILDSGGEIDRRRVGTLVFTDATARARLEAIVHPPLLAEIGRRVDHLRGSRAVGLVVVDAALWLQFEPPAARPRVDLVLMTTADRETRRGRIMRRDGLDAESAERRIEAQTAIEASLHRADAVLDTATDRRQAVTALLQLLDERLGLRLGESRPDRS